MGWIGTTHYTLTPITGEEWAEGIFLIKSDGGLAAQRLSVGFPTRPVVYLKSSTRILPNSNSKIEYGSKENPFILQ